MLASVVAACSLALKFVVVSPVSASRKVASFSAAPALPLANASSEVHSSNAATQNL
jgi:hypothetical protein